MEIFILYSCMLLAKKNIIKSATTRRLKECQITAFQVLNGQDQTN